MRERLVIIVDPRVQDRTIKIGGSIVLNEAATMGDIGFAATAKLIRVGNEHEATRMEEYAQIKDMEYRRFDRLVQQ